jgi:hypothetical protein
MQLSILTRLSINTDANRTPKYVVNSSLGQGAMFSFGALLIALPEALTTFFPWFE